MADFPSGDELPTTLARMRICLDARTAGDHFPGIGRYTVNLARALGPLLAGEDRLLLLRDPGPRSRWDLAPLAGDRVEVWDAPASPFALRQQWQLPPLLRRQGVDLYHSPYYLMPFYPGVPSVVTIHDLIPLRYPRLFSPVQRLIFAFAIRLAVRAARIVVAVSAATARDLQEMLSLPVDRIALIPEGVDPIFRPQGPAAIAAVRAHHALPESYALYVGSNKPHKNLVRLVEAWAGLRSRDVPLVTAGAWDPRYPEARDLAGRLGLGSAVRFLGPVEDGDLPALYSGARLFVLASDYEGFGLPVLEAMACGTPVACSRRGSLPEVAGSAALLFDPSSVEAIRDALDAVLADSQRREELSRLGLEQAARFTWDAAARATITAYRRVLP